MFKMLLTATRSFLKKTCAAVVTFAVRAVNGFVKMCTRMKDLAIEGWNWMGTKLMKPSILSMAGEHTKKKSSLTSTVMAGVKAICLQRFFLFLGGLICCFLLPDEAKGDLTWFEKMLTSSRDFLSTTAKNVLDSVTRRITGIYAKGGDLINTC